MLIESAQMLIQQCIVTIVSKVVCIVLVNRELHRFEYIDEIRYIIETIRHHAALALEGCPKEIGLGLPKNRIAVEDTQQCADIGVKFQMLTAIDDKKMLLNKAADLLFLFGAFLHARFNSLGFNTECMETGMHFCRFLNFVQDAISQCTLSIKVADALFFSSSGRAIEETSIGDQSGKNPLQLRILSLRFKSDDQFAADCGKGRSWQSQRFQIGEEVRSILHCLRICCFVGIIMPFKQCIQLLVGSSHLANMLIKDEFFFIVHDMISHLIFVLSCLLYTGLTCSRSSSTASEIGRAHV